MPFLYKIRKRLYNYFLTRKLNKLSLQHSIVHFEKAKSVGVLFEGEEVNARAIALEFVKYLEDSGKKVKHLAYIKKEEKDVQYNCSFFTNKEVNFIYIPSGKKVNQFLKHEFDVLVSLNTEENLPLEYLSYITKAKYRVGRFDNEKVNCYDLMLDVGNKKDLNYFIKLIHHYLNHINKNVQTV